MRGWWPSYGTPSTAPGRTSSTSTTSSVTLLQALSRGPRGPSCRSATSPTATGTPSRGGGAVDPLRPGPLCVRLSRYAEQLQRYLAVFPREQLLVLSYDALVRDPATALRQ